MTLKTYFEQNGYLPKSFFKEGTRFEFQGVEISNRFFVLLWQMKGLERERLYCYSEGDTETEAQENMIKKLMEE